MSLLEGRKILLGVCGGIASYKACELARMFVRAGAEVQAVLSPNAARFVSPLTFEALTGHPAPVHEYNTPEGSAPDDVYAHLNLTRGIDCFVIVPATADSIAKFAHGIADNLLCGAYLSCDAPVLIAPAMNVRMYNHPALQQNLETLRARGNAVMEVGSGSLACGDEGAGRLAELDEIFASTEALIAGRPLGELTRSYPRPEAAEKGAQGNGAAVQPAAQQAQGAAPLSGKKYIVTAGGTREYLDPVRFITNNSTGELSFAVVRELAALGAEVELVHTGIHLPDDVKSLAVSLHSVATAFDLQMALSALIAESSGLVMFAAVADFGPAKYSTVKRKKDGAAWSIELCETPDVLASMSEIAPKGTVLIGVSLEDEDWINRSMKKALKKNVDLMLAVELTPELPYGERGLNCALVTRDDIVASAARRTKPEAARLIGEWLTARIAASA